jgi:CheY-like chemotaxis protein
MSDVSNQAGKDTVEPRSLEQLAHDLNNLLSVMLGDLDFLQGSLSELREQTGKDAMLECVDSLQQAAQRLLALAKPLVELAKLPAAPQGERERPRSAIEEWEAQPTASGLRGPLEQTPTRLRPGTTPPAATPAAAPAPTEESGERRSPSRGGAAAGGTGPQNEPVLRPLILVVEDVEAERRHVARLLEQLDYRVVAIPDGREAVRVYREEKHVVLVLLDMVIPGLSGLDTFRALRKHDSQVKVLLVSGYVDEDRAEELLAEGAAGFLQKPFTLELLRRAVATALGGVRPVEH